MSRVVINRYQRLVAVAIMVLAAHLFLYAPNVAAIPLSEYQKNLKNAITAVEALFEMDEEDSEYDTKFMQTIEILRISLPAQQTVEAGGDVCNVDNSWLHHDLENLEKSDDHAEYLGQLLERLKALEQQITERQSASSSGESKGWSKSRLESILSRPEYVSGARGPNAITRLIQDFLRWLQSIFPKRQPMEPGRAVSVSRAVQIVIVVLAVLLLVYVASMMLRSFKTSRKYKTPRKRQARIVLGERLEPEETSTNLLSEAEALAKRGELRAAIRKGYIALLVELGDRKIISLAQHKTNRDYLRNLRDAPQLHSQMRGLTDSFERHWYGFVDANEADWQEFRAGYFAALQTGR